jgi:dTDP-4-dehydrorhamnose reductase
VKILVTGSRGQLGTALGPALARHDVVALSRAELDITSLEAVRHAVASHGPAVILNAAAYNFVDRAESEGAEAFRGNALGPRNLAIAAEERGALLVHFSTDYVFDGARGAPYHEWCPTHPLSVYAESKLAGEGEVRTLCRRHLIVRTAWVYATAGTNFPLKILALAEKGEVRVVDDQVGCPTFAPHLAAGVAQLLGTGAVGTFHLAGGGSTSWYGLAKALFERLGVQAKLTPIPSSAYPTPARRPGTVVLTTLQDPEIRLPSWEEGIREFTGTLRSRA